MSGGGAGPQRLPERFAPEDFVVEELPAYAPSGEGGHTFVRVEKRGRTTEEVARALARAAGVAPRDVGYAGRKDRHAVTTQWLSVPGLDPDAARSLPLPDARVLEAARHGHKLRTGHLRANRFVITLHGVDEETAARAGGRLDELVRRGMPNRFGAQRFGRHGDNAAAGARALRGETRPRDRRKLRFLVSALQAAAFNAALAARERPADELEAGDVALVHGSGGLFVVEDPAREAPRAQAFEISPTGPIFGTEVGRKIPAPAGAPARREARALRDLGIDPDAPLRPPRGLRVPGGRRALRVRPEAAGLAREGDALRVSFELPPGSYATVLLEEILGAAPPQR